MTSGPSGPSTPRNQRTRRGLEITLSDKARERLDALAKRHEKSRSQIVEELILAAR